MKIPINDICCPVCKNEFLLKKDSKGESLICSNDSCGSIYSIIQGVPNLIPQFLDKTYETKIEKQSDDDWQQAYTNLLDNNKKSLKNLKILKRFGIFNYPGNWSGIGLRAYNKTSFITFHSLSRRWTQFGFDPKMSRTE